MGPAVQLVRGPHLWRLSRHPVCYTNGGLMSFMNTLRRRKLFLVCAICLLYVPRVSDSMPWASLCSCLFVLASRAILKQFQEGFFGSLPSRLAHSPRARF